MGIPEEIKRKIDEMNDHMEGSREKIESSLQGAWEVFSERYHCTCGKCRPLSEEDIGEVKEAFMGGAMSFLMALNGARRTERPGAILEKLDALSTELDEYSRDIVANKLGNMVSTIVKSAFLHEDSDDVEGAEDDNLFPTIGNA